MKFINALRPALLVRNLSKAWVSINAWMDRLEGREMLSEFRALRKQSESDAKKLRDSIATLDANQSDRHRDASKKPLNDQLSPG